MIDTLRAYVCFVTLLCACGTRDVPQSVSQNECHGLLSVGLVLKDVDAIPVSGAIVAAIPMGRVEASAIAVTNDRGEFALCYESGTDHALTATHPSYGAEYVEPRPPSQHAGILRLRVGEATVRGRVASVTGAPIGGALIRAIRVSNSYGDVFYTRSDSAGGYEFSLPVGFPYRLAVVGKSLMSVTETVVLGADARRDLLAYDVGAVNEPIPDAAADWVKARIASSTGESLRALFAGAVVVGAGENSHGASELVEMRASLFEFLVREMGFRAIAIEAGFGELVAVNDYVLGGDGDAESAIAGVGYWVWDTEEMVAFVEWLREFNESSSSKVRFFGVDMQLTDAPYRCVESYVGRLPDAGATAAAVNQMSVLKDNDETNAVAQLPAAERHALRQRVATLARMMRDHREAMVGIEGLEAWLVAAQCVEVVAQALRLGEETEDYGGVRDRFMAENVEWIIRSGFGPVMLWGHNTHVARRADGVSESMGSVLARNLGSKYVALAATFYSGEVRAWNSAEPDQTKLSVMPVDVGTVPAGWLEGALNGLGIERFALDLRSAARSPIGPWLEVPRFMRDIGASFLDNQTASTFLPLPDYFDGILFVRRVSATRAQKTGLRGPLSR